MVERCDKEEEEEEEEEWEDREEEEGEEYNHWLSPCPRPNHATQPATHPWRACLPPAPIPRSIPR